METFDLLPLSKRKEASGEGSDFFASHVCKEGRKPERESSFFFVFHFFGIKELF
jgi:hypothetical protein